MNNIAPQFCEAIALIASAIKSSNLHGYRKRYPAHKRNTPTQTRVSKTIPGSKREQKTAKGSPSPSRVSKTIPSRQESPPRSHRYRKRYPAVGSIVNLMRLGRIASLNSLISLISLKKSQWLIALFNFANSYPCQGATILRASKG